MNDIKQITCREEVKDLDELQYEVLKKIENMDYKQIRRAYGKTHLNFLLTYYNIFGEFPDDLNEY